MVDPAHSDGIDTDELCQMAKSNNVDIRIKAAEHLGENFSKFRKKDVGWACLKMLAQDPESGVRHEAARAIGRAFPYIPDKTDAWDVLMDLARDDNFWVKAEAITSLHNVFRFSDDRQKSARNIVMLVQDENMVIRSQVTEVLGELDPEIPEKEEIWDLLLEIHRKNTFPENFIPDVPHKVELQDVLLKISKENCRNRRLTVINALSPLIPHIPDKHKVWHDLHGLLRNEGVIVRRQVIYALALALVNDPGSREIWDDLHRLLHHKDDYIADAVVVPMQTIFPYIPDKKHAWKHLITILKKKGGPLFLDTESAVFEILPHIPSLAADRSSVKEVPGIWKDILFLASSRAVFNRHRAARILAEIYPLHPDGESAWDDILQLTKPSYLKSHRQKGIPGDLSVVSEWEMTDLQAVAYHSLGRVCIYKATQAEDNAGYLRELKDGVKYFEKSLKKKHDGNPARFCSLFYHSLYSMVSGARNAEEEARQYLARAKEVVDREYPEDDNSESRQKKLVLLNAATSLSSAFAEINRAQEVHLALGRSTLDIYRLHNEQIADLLDDVDRKAPVASRVIWRTALTVDRQVKASLKKLETQSKQFCLGSRGTYFEPFGKILYNDIIKLGSEAITEEKILQQFNQIESELFTLGNVLYSKDEMISLFGISAQPAFLVARSRKITNIIKIFSARATELQRVLVQRDQEIDRLKNDFSSKLSNIITGFSRISASQAAHDEWTRQAHEERSRQAEELVQSVCGMQKDVSYIKETQREILKNNKEINNQITVLAESVEKFLIKLSSNDQKIIRSITMIRKIIENPADNWLSRFGSLASIISFIMPYLGNIGFLFR